jgi:hypothetical protein
MKNSYMTTKKTPGNGENMTTQKIKTKSEERGDKHTRVDKY